MLYLKMESSPSTLRANSKRFKWSDQHDELLIKEILTSNIWLTKPGSSNRGEKWKNISDILNINEPLKFRTSQRSVRERFQLLYARQKSRSTKQEPAVEASVLHATEHEILLDQLAAHFENAANGYNIASTDGVYTMVAEVENERERKRKSSISDDYINKRVRNISVNTVGFVDGGDEAEEEITRNIYNNDRHMERYLEAIHVQLQQQNQLLLQVIQQQQQQSNLIIDLIQQSEDKN